MTHQDALDLIAAIHELRVQIDLAGLSLVLGLLNITICLLRLASKR